MKQHPLVSLGWSMLPEHALVRRLANKLIREEGIRSLEYNKTRIRDAVRGTHPPYGFLQKRIEALTTEIPRQAAIIRKRRRMREDQAEDRITKVRSKEERMINAVRRILGLDYYDCRKGTIERFGSVQVIVAEAYHPKLYIRKDGLFHKWNLSRYRSYDSHTGRFLNAFHPDAGLDEWIRKGYGFRFDFDSLATVLTGPSGEQVRLSWLESGSYSRHERPKRDRPSDWPKLPPGKSRRKPASALEERPRG